MDLPLVNKIFAENTSLAPDKYLKLSVTAIIAAKNEAANIGRCIEALDRAERIVVVDSQSTDKTCAIAESLGAEVLQFQYKGGYPKKRQWAMDCLDVQSDWIFLIDADEVVTKTLWQKISDEISSENPRDAYFITKGFHFLHKRFRFGGFSHAAVLLIRNGKGRFESLDEAVRTEHDMEVHERIIVDGNIGTIREPLIHEDFKGLAAYIDRHNQYSTWEAAIRYKYLRSGSYGDSTIEPKLFGNTQERRRFLKRIAVRVPFEPLFWFIYHYVLRLGFLEGRAGFVASVLRAQYISNVRMKMCELRVNDKSS